MEKKIERLRIESKALREEILKENGGQPIVLAPEDRKRLRELSEKFDPEEFEKYSLFTREELMDDEDVQP